jgi:hypothetical protein
LKAGLISVAPNGRSHGGDEPDKAALHEIGCALTVAPKGPANALNTPEAAGTGEAGWE